MQSMTVCAHIISSNVVTLLDLINSLPVHFSKFLPMSHYEALVSENK